MARLYVDLLDRIFAKSVVSIDSFYAGEPCWIWLGNTRANRTGMHYGYYNERRNGKVVHLLLHREIVRQIKHRRLTKRSVVLHLCNNTLCCNPDHLDGGSQKKNMRQCVADGRHVSGFKKCHDSTLTSKVSEPLT